MPASRPGRSGLAHRMPRGRAPAGRRTGFTAIELLVVIVLLGVLAAVAVPRLDGALSQRGPAWREQVVAALRSAHAIAQGHRRLVCASIAAASVTLTIASANPAGSCNTALPGPDADPRWAWDSGAPATAGVPATLYFQPDGRVTSDGAGSTAVNATVTISGQSSVSVNGTTGHVE